MTMRELYTFAIRKGMSLDPQGIETLEAQMARCRKEYEILPDDKKWTFEKERCTNPFGDTRILVGDPHTELHRILVGIDILGAEVLLAAALTASGRKIDMVLSHHASALAGDLASPEDVLIAQVKMMTDAGVPKSKAQKLVRETMKGKERPWDARHVQVAEALSIPLMGIHGPADLCMFQYYYSRFEEHKPETVGDLVDLLNEDPEVRWTMNRYGKGTEVAVGHCDDDLGRIYGVFYGGWNPTPPCFEALCEAGIGTMVCIATSDELNKIASKHHVNIVVIPHYPADNVGLNLLLDEAMDELGEIEVMECSNYVRIDRRSHP